MLRYLWSSLIGIWLLLIAISCSIVPVKVIVDVSNRKEESISVYDLDRIAVGVKLGSKL